MHLFLKFSLGCLAGLVLLSGCLTTNNAYTRVAPGIWRGVLELDHFNIPVRKKDTIFTITDQFKEGDLPFSFEVVYLDEQRFYLEIINGAERIRCDSVRFGFDRSTARDTMTIYFPEYASYIHAEVRGGAMQGEWVVTTKDDYRIPFYAQAGRNYRFTPLNQKPEADLSGEWATLFGIEQANEPPERAIGEFRQSGNHLEGTFRTETGDYRYLEGTIQGHKFWLSCFDGAHAYRFAGSIQGDTLQGEFRSGKHFRSLWKSWRDPAFQLGNPDSLTTLKAGAAPFQFSLPTAEGPVLNFPGLAFEGKVKIFTVMGTWCPNCRDEQLFLTEYLKKNPGMADKIAIVGFAFERHKDPTQARLHLLNYKKQMGIPFELVYAGRSGTDEAARVFPALNRIMAFPTMIILDQKNQVQRIHTGFDGPATSKYADFEKKFDQLIRELIF